MIEQASDYYPAALEVLAVDTEAAVVACTAAVIVAVAVGIEDVAR